MLQVLCCCSKFPELKKSPGLTDCYLEAAGNLEVNMQKNQSHLGVPPNLAVGSEEMAGALGDNMKEQSSEGKARL